MRHHPDQDIVATFRLRRRNVVRAKFTEGSDHEELYNREKPNQHPIEAITDLAETLELKQNLLISGANIKTINNESILGEGNINIQGGGGGSELNEFVITQEIFDEYKNENDYADLADIIDSEEITRKVINLNNFDFFLNNLTVSNKDLTLKNGNIILDSNGVDGTCDKAITASNCELIFKDCTLSAIDCENPINAVIDLNNSNLLFDNVIADNINFSESKSFIQTTSRCEVNIKESDIELLNNDESEDEPENVLTFIRVLTDNTLIKMMDSIIKIDKPIGDNLRYFQHKMISTAENVDTEINIINSYLEIEDNYHLPHTHKEYELSNIFDVNLDNTNIDIINSCINNQSVLRPESKYKFEQGKSFTIEDPHCINIYDDIEARGHYNEDEEHIFEEINVDEDTFLSIVDYQEGEYIFIYNDSNWTLNDEPVNIEDYGITYTLVEDVELYDGVEIKVYYSKEYQSYKILKDFTVESDDIENYTKIIKDTIIDDTVPGIEFIRVENEEHYINTINDILEENDYPIDDIYYEEYTYDNDEWYLKLYRIVSETEDVVIQDEVVDLNEFGDAIQIGLNDETPDLVNGMKFTIVSQTPYLEKRGLHINKCYNSVLAQDTFDGHKFSEYFINNHTIGETSVFGVHKIASENIDTGEIDADNIYANTLSIDEEEGDYFLPIHNENLESNNVKDAINELADRESSTNSLFDIKTIITPNVENNKGWACTCYDEPHKLNENQVAEAYHEIENALNQEAESNFALDNRIDISNIDVTNMFYADGYYYFVYGSEGQYQGDMIVGRTSNIDGNGMEEVINLTSELGVSASNLSVAACDVIEKDNEIFYVFYIINFSDYVNLIDNIIIYDKNWELIMNYSSNPDDFIPSFYGTGAVLGKDEYSNKIFIPNIVYNMNTSEYCIRLVTYDIESQDYEVLIKDWESLSYINTLSTKVSFYNNKIWMSTCNSLISIDLNNNYNIANNTIVSYSPTSQISTGNQTIIFNEDFYYIVTMTISTGSVFLVYKYNEEQNNWEEWYVDERDNNEYTALMSIQQHKDFLIIDTNTKIYLSRELSDLQTLTEIINYGNLILADDKLSVSGTTNSNGYSYFDIVENRISSIDTYNINGEEVAIIYYKCGNYKICEAGQNNRDDGEDENDSKLQDVYEYLGYLPYFWIDTENLDIVLPRNSNRWTMMYVGNNYIEEEMPEGNYSAFATKDEIKNISGDSLPDQTGNAGKFLTTNGSTTNWDYVESIKNQNNTQTSPVKLWTGNEAEFKQNSFDNWQEITPSTTLTYAYSNCYSNGKYLFIKGYTFEGNQYIYSEDGITWTSATSALPSDCHKTKSKWVNDRFVSLNRDNGAYEYSFDGINWTTGTLPIVDGNAPWDIVYGNGKYVVLFQNAYDQSISINKVVYSTDCENWTVATITNEISSNDKHYWRTITFFKGKFIAFRLNSNMVAYSEDAINWTTTTIANEQYGNYYWVANSNDICVAICNGRPAVCTSTDGINWIERAIPDANRHCIIYDGARFVLLPGYAASAPHNTNKILISTDGLNWTYSNKLMPVSNEFMCAIYGNNKLITISYDNLKIYVQNYIPLSTTNPDYLSFVEDTKIQLGNGVILEKEIPSQEGNSGKYLKTDGTDASWEDVELPQSSLQEAATVAITGDYEDLSNKPAIPTVNNNTITITQGGTTKGSFTLNQNTNATIALDAGGGSSADLSKINNYTGSIISDNFVLSVTSGDDKYFTPKDNITDIFTADKWKIKLAYKYLGKHDTWPLSAGVIACMGVAGGNGTPTAKGFLITHSSGGFALRLSSDGETWDIFDGNVAISLNGYNPNEVYSFILEFTGTGYYLYGKAEGTNENYQLMQYVQSSTKISCGSDNSSVTIIFGTGIDNEDSCDHYQTFADWYLKECYTRIGDVQYDFTMQWHNLYKPDIIETYDYDEMEIKGHSIYITNSYSPIANEITINSCEDSSEESYIKLVVDDNPNTLVFNDTSGLKWIGGKPTLQAGKTYQIVIVNKVGYYMEI